MILSCPQCGHFLSGKKVSVELGDNILVIDMQVKDCLYKTGIKIDNRKVQKAALDVAIIILLESLGVEVE